MYQVGDTVLKDLPMLPYLPTKWDRALVSLKLGNRVVFRFFNSDPGSSTKGSTSLPSTGSIKLARIEKQRSRRAVQGLEESKIREQGHNAR